MYIQLSQLHVAVTIHVDTYTYKYTSMQLCKHASNGRYAGLATISYKCMLPAHLACMYVVMWNQPASTCLSCRLRASAVPEMLLVAWWNLYLFFAVVTPFVPSIASNILIPYTQPHFNAHHKNGLVICCNAAIVYRKLQNDTLTSSKLTRQRSVNDQHQMPWCGQQLPIFVVCFVNMHFTSRDWSLLDDISSATLMLFCRF